MASDPFAALTWKKVLAARLRGLGRRCLRPLRPARIAAHREGPPNLLILAVDTLRYDHLGPAGYERATTPHIDDLARAGTWFSDVTAASPWTLPSFASALCGLSPGLHRARLTGQPRNMDSQPPERLAGDVTTLAAHLRGQGYRTAAFYSNHFFAFGLAETFAEHAYHNLPAEFLADIALDWIRRHADQPFFCFVLFNDPHEPTTPPIRDLAPLLRALPADLRQASARELRGLSRWGDPSAGGVALGRAADPLDAATERALALKVAIYDASIRQVDRAIGRCWQQLAGWRLADNTLLTIFSDHGEEFLDHLREARAWNHDPRALLGVGHGHTHFQELLHVPWLAVGPGVPRDRRHTAPVSLCDLAPTVSDWLGVEPLVLPTPGEAGVVDGLADGLVEGLVDGMTGRSLRSDIAVPNRSQVDRQVGRQVDREVDPAEGSAEPSGERFLLAEAIAYGPDLVALRRGQWKLIARRDGHPLGLYDLAADPTEQVDQSAQQPDLLREFQDHLARWRAAGDDDSGHSSSARWGDLSDTVRQRLKDLGYSE